MVINDVADVFTGVSMVSAIWVVAGLVTGQISAPSLTPEQQMVAEVVDAAEAAVNESAYRGKTADFIRMWLDRGTAAGAARLEKLAKVDHGVFCFIVAGLDLAFTSVKTAYAAKGRPLPAGLEKVDRTLGQWQEECRGSGGKAAEDAWLEIGALLVVLGRASGPVARSVTGAQLLAELNARGVLISGFCNPIGFCMPNSAAPPAIPRETVAVIIAAAMVLGLVPWGEPVTVPVLLRLATQ